MYIDVKGQLKLGCSSQALSQDFFLDFELMIVGGVLVVASAAAAKMWTGRRNAMRRRLDDGVGLRSRKTRFLFDEGRLNFLTGQDKRDEYGLAATVGFVSERIGRKTGESVAAIDQLFDCEAQGLILRHECAGQTAVLLFSGEAGPLHLQALNEQSVV
jgi:hypothetical protein